jgi:AAA domain
MSLRIIRSFETIPVEHPIFLLGGDPGICKSSLGYSARQPLTLDFDQGAHRAANRQDTLRIGSIVAVEQHRKDFPEGHPEHGKLVTLDEFQKFVEEGGLDPYRSVVPDTVGRCLDVMAADIAHREPKKAPRGVLTQQGWGALKSEFAQWISGLRNRGKDILLITHVKEERGDARVVRADIAGGSLNEVLKIADFVGYVFMDGKQRVIDFNPSELWPGKNPAQWPRQDIPPVEKAQTFMADLFDKGRLALGKISEASAKLAQQVEDWRADIETYTKVEEFNRAVPKIQALGPAIAPQVGHLLKVAASKRGFAIENKQFVEKKLELVESFL